MITIGSLIMLLYSILLICMVAGYFRLNKLKPESGRAKNKFSVIIPFRNEEKSLPGLLRSIGQLNYPVDHFELLFVDDASEDNSVIQIKEHLKHTAFNWQLLINRRVSQAPKKDAITLAVSVARFPWIVTTDADCILPEAWLNCIDSQIVQANTTMVCGPVKVSGSPALLTTFQVCENLALQGITMGGFGWSRPLLSNGANLAYRKDAFYEVKGFKGNDTIASGDDMFLLDKFRKQYPGKIQFANDAAAIIETSAHTTWRSVFNQRVRWAAKTASQKDPWLMLISLLIFLTNLWLVIGLVWTAFNPELLMFYVGLFLLKLTIDLVFIAIINWFFGLRIPLQYLLPGSLLYPFISTAVAVRSIFGKYSWKGRQFNR